MTSTDCGHDGQRLVVTTLRTTFPERDDDGVYVLLPDDFEEPDHIQVELVCRACKRSQLLDNDEWEVA